MSKQPTEFQKATAEAIVRHLTEHERALCADEAGLGKTITASTVIRELAFQKLTRQLDTAKKWICEWWKALSKPRKLSVSQSKGGEAKRRVYAFRVFYHSVTGRKAAEDHLQPSFVTQAVLSLKPVAPSCKLGLPSHHSHVSLFAKDGWNMESHYTILLIFVYV